MTGRPVRALPVLLFLALAGPPAAAQTEPAPPWPALAPEIRTVASLGHWSEGEHSGSYRVVLLRGGTETPATRLFVQWMTEGDGAAPAVLASAEAEVFGELAGATVQRPAWRALGRNRLEITATARTPDGRWHRLRQVATTPGRLTRR